MHTTKSWRNHTGLMLLAAFVTALAGIAAFTSIDSNTSQTWGWENFTPAGAQEVEKYETFEDMAVSSDLTLVSKIEKIQHGRSIVDESGDALVFSEWILKGADGEVIVEQPLFNVEDGADTRAVVTRLDKAKPSNEFVFFLREKADRPGTYRLVNLAGLWSGTDAGLVAPLAEEHEVERLVEIAGAPTSLEQLELLASKN